eukprot:PRCOL_00005662-RA
MDNALVDDRRIRVDFSQSVKRLFGKYRSGGARADRASGLEAEEFGGAGGGRSGGGRGRGRGGRFGSGGRGGRGASGGRFGSHGQREGAPQLQLRASAARGLKKGMTKLIGAIIITRSATSTTRSDITPATAGATTVTMRMLGVGTTGSGAIRTESMVSAGITPAGQIASGGGAIARHGRELPLISRATNFLQCIICKSCPSGNASSRLLRARRLNAHGVMSLPGRCLRAIRVRRLVRLPRAGERHARARAAPQRA